MAPPPDAYGSCRLGPGRVKAPRKRKPRSLAWKRNSPVRLFLVDSGCTWHCHNILADFINLRAANEVIDDANGNVQKITQIGDLPVRVRDHRGVEHRLMIRDVRYTPQFTDSLLSVNQFWESSNIAAVFQDRQEILVPGKDGPTRLPIYRDAGISCLTCQSIAGDLSSPDGYEHVPRRGSGKGTAAGSARRSGDAMRRPHTSSHISALPPDEAAAFMHRRLHLGADIIQRLPSMCRDAPEVLARATKGIPCAHCVEANAPKVSKRGSNAYSPSHAGRTMHMDIAGPFKPSAVGGFKYTLVLVDDHTRHKFVYFLKSKDQALTRTRQFIAEFNALASRTSPTPVRAVGSIHCDNAGEFLSHEFSELMDTNLIARTTCPPHVHELNGVAERAIRSIFSVVRSNLTASGAPVGFWPHAVSHAVDCLNRTTGPPGSDRSAHELLTGGESPKIMNILPFGCEAFAVKPRSQYRKTEIEAHAWRGINLGRSERIPGSYDIWLPQHLKIVSTSEVYFRECLMPWRPKGDRTVGDAAPLPPPPADTHSPGVPSVPSAGLSDLERKALGGPQRWPSPPVTAKSLGPCTPDTPVSFASAYSGMTRSSAGTSARSSRKVLVLFSGAYQRCDGIAAFLRARGLDSELIDNDVATGGGPGDDVLNDKRFADLYQRVAAGEFLAVFAAPPCSTFSVSRFMPPRNGESGPPVVRKRKEIRGVKDVPRGHVRELGHANRIVARTTAILHAAASSGAEFILENPADRGDPAVPHLFEFPDHGPIWLMDEVLSLGRKHLARMCTFPMCELGGDFQKYTTLMYSRGFESAFNSLDKLRCSHPAGAHKPAGGHRLPSGEWASRESAAYPPDFNLFIADAVVRLITSIAAATSAPPVKTAAAAPATADDDEDDATGAVLALADTVPSTAPRAAVSPAAPKVSSRAAAMDPRAVSFESSGQPGDPGGQTWLPIIYETDSASPSPSPAGTSVDSPAAAGLPLQSQHIDEQFDRLPARFQAGRVRGPATRTRMRARGESVLDGSARQASEPPRQWGSCRHASSQAVAELAGDLPMQWGSCRTSVESADSSPSQPDSEPRNHREAMKFDRATWTEAELLELRNHEKNGSYELVQRSKIGGRRPVNFTWAYKIKRSGKRKARLCVQGCSQIPGVDFDQTFCAAMRQSSLRVLSAAAARLNLAMNRWDFVSAYLQGELLADEVIFCRTPPGVEPKLGADGLEMVYAIRKPIYGMAQAGRRWQRTIFPYLVDGKKGWSFTATHADPCVFVCRKSVDTPSGPREEVLIVGCYVDDLFVLSSHRDEHSLYSQFTTSLAKDWDVEDEGAVNDLLSVQISREEDGHVLLRQTAYIDKLVGQYFPDGVPPVGRGDRTPCDKSIEDQVRQATLLREQGNVVDPALLTKYQSLVGALLYCAVNTRPDVAYGCGMLCRCMCCPTPDLMDAALRVLGYLHRHREIGLRYAPVSDDCVGYSDSNWDVKRSTSGAVFIFGQAAISWGSTKQTSVALSSCEAEIMAASEAAKDALYLQAFLVELGLATPEQIASLSVDNTAAIDLAYNPQHHKRTKHIERRHFFVRECVEAMRLNVPYVRSPENLSDMFTKPLEARQFFALRDRVMNVAHAPES